MPTKITLQQGDITTLDVEAIVNSANNDLVLGGGVSGALRRLGGPAIQEECNRIGTIPLGEAAVTTAGNLKAKLIIHAATNPLGLWADEKSVRTAARNVFKRVAERGIKSVAIPAIGTGAGGFPIDRCADVLLEELQEHLKAGSPLDSAVFVLYEEKPYKAFEDRFMRKMPDAWTAMTGKPVPPLPPEPPPEPEPPPPPPPRREPPRHAQPRGGPPQQQRGWRDRRERDRDRGRPPSAGSGQGPRPERPPRNPPPAPQKS